MSYEKIYPKIYSWFQKHLKVYKVFFVLYHFLPVLTVLLYIDLIVLAVRYWDLEMILKIILVPAVTFLAVTLLRKFIDTKRPYTKYDITPLIQKEKKGESMPSRHTASITIIAFAWLYVSVPFGIVMLLLSLLMGALRVLGGVHFVKDICAAYLIAAFAGIIGFFII
jgi:membrane-associated phospholipid phosphatase